jgi:Phosphate-selective porin O and P
LSGRYSFLDLSGGPIDGGRMTIISGGLNWYWTSNIRWKFGYGFAHVVDGPSPGNLNIFQGRFQIVF